MSKQLTKAEIDKLASYSIKGEVYVRLDDVQTVLEAREEDKANGKGDVARSAGAGADRPKGG